jgi:hypothetical protein
MERWPELVNVEDRHSCLSESWETIVFELQDVLEEAIDAVLEREDARSG